MVFRCCAGALCNAGWICGAELSLFPQTRMVQHRVGCPGGEMGAQAGEAGEDSPRLGERDSALLCSVGITNPCRNDTVYFKQLTKHYLKD